MDATPAGRFGDPREFGAICAFLCSVHAGYIAGQNILVDGGGIRERSRPATGTRSMPPKPPYSIRHTA